MFVMRLIKISGLLLLCCLNEVISQGGITVTDSIYSGGKYRSYRLYIPAAYSGSVSVPLILNLHGYTSNAYQQQVYSNFMPIADTAGFLMVYPQGTNDIYGQPFWNAGIASTSVVNDTLFLNQLIDSLRTMYNIDSTRVYMTGLSNGGFMSHYMACFCNRKITAIASVAGTFFTFWPPCNPNKVVPVMHIHGTADPTVPYYGNANMLSADSTIGRWVVKNNCNPVPSYSAVPDINTTDGSTAEHYRYFKTGNAKSIVEFFKINNGAHTWPGSPYIIGTTNQDINASAEIWRFFRQFSSADFPTFVESVSVKNNFLVYPNPAYDKVNIYSETFPINEVEIKDIMGKIIFHQIFDIHKNYVELDITGISKGIYFITVNGLPEVKKIMIN